MRKKLIAGFLIMLVSMCFSITAFALAEGDWVFQLSDDGATITGYNGDGGDVIIPETIYGVPVTKIDLEYDKNLNNATSLIIKGKVTELGDLFSYGSTIQTVTLPEGLKSLEATFRECQYLNSINIPSTVAKIGRNTFEKCTSLETISLPEGIEKIGGTAFSRSGLKNIYLPYVTELDEAVFFYCKNLKKVTIANGYTFIPAATFSGCTSLTEIIVPNTVQKICVNAFEDCTSLKQIILPTSLKEIHGIAFEDCDSLKEVVIPYGTQIIENAFAYCDNLKSLYIPDTVTEIDTGRLTGVGIITGSDNCIIYCTANSEAAKTCKEYNIPYLTDNSVNTGINVYYNGTRVSFHAYDQNPEIVSSRTLVPLRAIFETMDAEVEWDAATSTVIAKRGKTEIKITIGENKMYKDGKEISVDVPAQIINSRTMIPVRIIAEAFGADVAWNGNGNAVLINE